MPRSTKHRPKIDPRVLDEKQRAAWAAAGFEPIVGELPKYGFEKVSLSHYHLHGSSLPSHVRHSPEAVAQHQQLIAEKVAERSYRGFVSNGNHTCVNAPSDSVILSDLPRVLPVKSMDDIKPSHVVFIDMMTGTVQAVLPRKDIEGIAFWRRYYSLVVGNVQQITGAKLRKLAATDRKVIYRDGEPVAWLQRGKEILDYLSGPRMPSNPNDYDWTSKPKPVTFVRITAKGIPANTSPHVVRQYHMRYSTFKPSPRPTVPTTNWHTMV